eukprot:TRINITY_DN654_c0_g1_i10.p2 TRINITY_DN654_c0_g1~~TRINITY_DN654_c0_g1_i10.p2  ORF type:complete len:515 (+),score=170.72 TRINITY_DN654_c0_g1_i10:59-1546(+)
MRAAATPATTAATPARTAAAQAVSMTEATPAMTTSARTATPAMTTSARTAAPARTARTAAAPARTAAAPARTAAAVTAAAGDGSGTAATPAVSMPRPAAPAAAAATRARTAAAPVVRTAPTAAPAAPARRAAPARAAATPAVRAAARARPARAAAPADDGTAAPPPAAKPAARAAAAKRAAPLTSQQLESAGLRLRAGIEQANSKRAGLRRAEMLVAECRAHAAAWLRPEDMVGCSDEAAEAAVERSQKVVAARHALAAAEAAWKKAEAEMEAAGRALRGIADGLLWTAAAVQSNEQRLWRERQTAARQDVEQQTATQAKADALKVLREHRDTLDAAIATRRDAEAVRDQKRAAAKQACAWASADATQRIGIAALTAARKDKSAAEQWVRNVEALRDAAVSRLRLDEMMAKWRVLAEAAASADDAAVAAAPSPCARLDIPLPSALPEWEPATVMTSIAEDAADADAALRQADSEVEAAERFVAAAVAATLITPMP